MTSRVALIGWPVEHSVSPPMHNAAFEALGLDWHYERVAIEPDRLIEGIDDLLFEGFVGFNVTVPHKPAVLNLPCIGRVDSAVGQIGAVNTLVRQDDGTLHAANTDWMGFTGDLHFHGISVQGTVCLILGTGGSAKAVDYALRMEGAKRVIKVSRGAGESDDVIRYEDLAGVDPVDLVVNCTPIGMQPNDDASPWPVNTPIPEGATLYDLIYNPPVTRLMHRWEAAGNTAIGGLGMLVRQGALASQMWTGQTPPLDVMTAAARNALALKP